MYTPLNSATEEIRLLKVLSCSSDDESVCCDLVTVSLEGDFPSYAALSYVWGDATVTEKITINGQPRQVTASLASALKQFSRAFVNVDSASNDQATATAIVQAAGSDYGIEDLDYNENASRGLIWADAVCINQNDVAERGQQVSMMGLIYRKASMVMSWLGPAIDVPDITSVDLGLELLRTCASHVEEVKSNNGGSYPSSDTAMTSEELDFLRDRPAFYEQDSARFARNKAWNAIDELSQNTYWTRVWVVQELVLAQRVGSSILFWGTHSITLRQLLDFNSFTDRFLDQQPPKPSYFDQRVWDWVIKDKRLRLMFVDLVKHLRSSELQGGYSYALAVSLQCSSTDPRDAVFGVCGMLGVEISPSYEMSTADVYRQYVSVVLSGTSLKGFFDVAGLIRLGRTTSEFPSWVPRLHNLKGDRDAFISAGLSTHPFIALNAICPGIPSIVDDKTMHFSGVRLDSCLRIFRQPGADIPEYPETIQKFRALCLSFIEQYGSEYPKNGRRCLEDLLFAVCSGLDNRLNPLNITNSIDCVPASAFRMLMEWAVAEDSDNPSIDLLVEKSALDAAFLGPDAPVLADMASSVSQAIYEEGFHAMIALLNTVSLWAYCPLFRTQKGHMGRAPAAVAEGDLICLLQGFSGPCLLREQMGHYVLVGACYVNGYSDREPVEAIRKGEVELESFFVK